MKTTVIILLAAIVYLLFEHRQERLHDRQAKERAEIMAEQKKREDAANLSREIGKYRRIQP